MKKCHLAVVCLVWLITVHTAVSERAVRLRLKKNGYIGLLVVVGENVKEDASLIDKIKDKLNDASNLLFNATNRRAYFKKATIVIPKHWTNYTAAKERNVFINKFKEHILVDQPNKAKGSAPYVRGNMECGKAGWYMHLTPEFLNMKAPTPYGKHANAIVHEWGHLRWGLFDEYPSVDAPGTVGAGGPKKTNFYPSGGMWRPVACTRETQGQALFGNCDPKRPCDNYLTAIKPHPDCKFCPSINQPGLKASLMSNQWIDNMDSFCDEDKPSTPENIRHNSQAPNLQNNVCNGRSAWEVMREHDDFRRNRNPPVNISQQIDPIEFTVFKRSPRKRVFVLDTSGSMAIGSIGGTRILQLEKAALFVIDNIIESNSWLGIIEFNSRANIRVGMTHINNSTARETLKKGVPNTVTGSTEIQLGLQAAVKMLEDAFDSIVQTEIILISDGENNRPYDDYFPELVNKSVIVHTIAISNSADEKMTELAELTGGGSYTYLETNSLSLADVLSQVVTSEQDSEDAAEKLFSESHQASFNVTDEFYIDQGMGNDTVIVVVLNSNTDIQVSMVVVGPNNVTYNESDTTTMLRMSIPGTIPAGRYVYTISMSVARPTDVSVTSLPVADIDDVIRVTSSLSNTTVDFNSAEEIKLYVNVERGGSPVLKATVKAVLAADSGFTPITISMQDKGTGPDIIANDGIYSAYLIKKYFNGTSRRYSTKIFVTGDNETFTFDITSGSAPIPGAVAEPVYELKLSGDFQRQSIPQEIVVTNYNPSQVLVDVTPPAQIADLTVTNIVNNQAEGEESITYTLAWTAMGDDMDIGQAKNYSLRLDKDINNLRNIFNTSTPVNQALPAPKPSGQTETLNVTLTLNDCNGTCYMALKTTDEVGLESPTSNVAVVDIDFSYKSVEEVERTTSTTTQQTTTKSSTTTADKVSNTNPKDPNIQTQLSDETRNLIIILVTVPIFLFCMIAIGLIFYFRKQLRSNQKQDNRSGSDLKNEGIRYERTHVTGNGGRVWTAFESRPYVGNYPGGLRKTPMHGYAVPDMEDDEPYSSRHSTTFYYGRQSAGYHKDGRVMMATYPSMYAENDGYGRRIN